MRIQEISREIHQNNKDKGFWDSERNVGEMLMLVTSELSEALEADREDKRANVEAFNRDKLGTPFHEQALFKSSFEENIKNSFEDEIADAVIRLFDMAEGLGIDLEWHIRAKLDYNKLRPKMHGKKY